MHLGLADPKARALTIRTKRVGRFAKQLRDLEKKKLQKEKALIKGLIPPKSLHFSLVEEKTPKTIPPIFMVI